MTIVETGPNQGLSESITRARNTQNAVRAVDFAALDANQERIRRELAVSGIEYHYRPSVAASAKGAITVERASRALAALHGDVALAVVAEEFRALSDPSSKEYKRLFTAELSGTALARRVAIFDFLDSVLDASERAETLSSRRLFYRHSRFFLMSTLAKRNSAILGAPNSHLSEPDSADLSRKILELAELAYGLSSQFGTGHLATFRSLSSVIPLEKKGNGRPSCR